MCRSLTGGHLTQANSVLLFWSLLSEKSNASITWMVASRAMSRLTVAIPIASVLSATPLSRTARRTVLKEESYEEKGFA